MLARQAHRLACVLPILLVSPALGVLANRTGADEGRDLDWDANTLRDLDHRPDVALEGARRAQRLDPEMLVADFHGQPFHIAGGSRPRRRQAEIDRTDTELISQVH